MKDTLKELEAVLIAACDAVNADPALNASIDEWKTVTDPIEEPWDAMEVSQGCALRLTWIQKIRYHERYLTLPRDNASRMG